VKGQLPLSVGELGGQGVKQFGRSATLVSLLDHQLPFLDHVHEFYTNQRVPGCRTRLEPEHGTRDPLHASMVLCDNIMKVFDLADRDGSAMLMVVTLDGGFIGVTAVNRDRLGDTVAADRLLQEP
jgi:hypothetical protein